jgi:hypothetical protein
MATNRHEAEHRFTALLDEAGLQHPDSVSYDAETEELHFVWEEQQLVVVLELDRDHLEEIDEPREPIDVYVPGSADDPRTVESIPGVTIHRGPPLHPDDMTVHNGIPCTSPSRTLIDCAEVVSIDEIREMFARARDIGLLDPEAMRAARARVEWRPSLAMLDVVIEEFC